MATIRYFKNYNSYFNRIIKHDTALGDIDNDYVDTTDINFNPNDGLHTELIVNWTQTWTPDYMMIYGENGIEQRWFILESHRTRSGQYKFTFKRDVIADNYDKVINAPMVVNRAMVNDINNPLLYNPEGFSFNQIKKQEILLKDKSQTP